MHRHLKQFIYGLLYLVVFGGIVSLVYFVVVRPDPACSDGKQNQGEEGIDCGGPCVQVCLSPGLLPVQVTGDVRVMPVGDTGRVSLLAEVQNPNGDFGVQQFNYTFRLYRSDGVPLDTIGGTSFLYPREVKYIRMPNVSFGERVGYAELEVSDFEWVPADEFRRPSLLVQDVRTLEEGVYIAVRGALISRDTVMLREVMLVALFYNTRGEIVGVSETEVTNILPNETRTFGILHPLFSEVDLERTRVFAESLRSR